MTDPNSVMPAVSISGHPVFLWLPERLDDPWTVIQDGQQQLLSGRDQKACFKGMSPKAQTGITVIISGRLCRSIAVDLHNLKGRERDQAVRYQVEDQLGESLDQVHLVLDQTPHSPAEIDGQTALKRHRVLVIAHHIMQDILTALETVGLTPEKLVVDYDLVHSDGCYRVAIPSSKNTISKHHIIKTGQQPFTIGEDLLAYASIDHQPETIALADFVQKSDLSQPVNLLSGPYSVRHAWYQSVGLTPWHGMAAAILMAAFGLAYLATSQSISAYATSLQDQTRLALENHMGRPTAVPLSVILRRAVAAKKQASNQQHSSPLIRALAVIEPQQDIQVIHLKQTQDKAAKTTSKTSAITSALTLQLKLSNRRDLSTMRQQFIDAGFKAVLSPYQERGGYFFTTANLLHKGDQS